MNPHVPGSMIFIVLFFPLMIFPAQVQSNNIYGLGDPVPMMYRMSSEGFRSPTPLEIMDLSVTPRFGHFKTLKIDLKFFTPKGPSSNAQASIHQIVNEGENDQAFKLEFLFSPDRISSGWLPIASCSNLICGGSGRRVSLIDFHFFIHSPTGQIKTVQAITNYQSMNISPNQNEPLQNNDKTNSFTSQNNTEPMDPHDTHVFIRYHWHDSSDIDVASGMNVLLILGIFTFFLSATIILIQFCIQGQKVNESSIGKLNKSGGRLTENDRQVDGSGSGSVSVSELSKSKPSSSAYLSNRLHSTRPRI